MFKRSATRKPTMRFFKSAALFMIAVGAMFFGIYSDFHGWPWGIWTSGLTIVITIGGLMWAAVKEDQARYQTLTQQVIQRAKR